jgi:hypothetical protein
MTDNRHSMIRLTSGQLSSITAHKPREDQGGLRSGDEEIQDSLLADTPAVREEQCKSSQSKHSVSNPSRSQVVRLREQVVPRLRDFQPILAFLFELTEWVYHSLTDFQQPALQKKSQDLLDTYQRCLSWYENVQGLLSAEEYHHPFSLFVQ